VHLASISLQMPDHFVFGLKAMMKMFKTINKEKKPNKNKEKERKKEQRRGYLITLVIYFFYIYSSVLL